MTDGVGRIVLVNAAAERLFGYRRDELIGRTMDMLVPERLRSGYVQRRLLLAQRQEPMRLGENLNLCGLHRDGSELPLEIGLIPIRSRGGLMVLGVFVDISERKRVEHLKDEFVSTVSHELRTPLTSIAGSLGLLSAGRAGTLPVSALRLIRIAESNSRRLVRLINDILDIEKIESGQVVFKFRRISAAALVEQVIDANRAYADGFRVRIRLNSPKGTTDIYADADRMAQVVTNLLSNAVKFSPASRVVDVDVAERDNVVRISVRDHGPGIPAAFKPRIFERFAQADATDARQKSGTGLGLSIVKQIVVRLAGTVGFEDAPGGGTLFFVDLPSWRTIAASEIDDRSGPGTLRVLLCEDDPDLAAAMREGLRPFGFNVDFAHVPADAVERAVANNYAAIVVDFDLPDQGGVALIRRLREQPRLYRTPIAVLGPADDDRKPSAEASQLKFTAYVTKPVEFDQLARILNEAAIGDANGRPRILHVEDDLAILAFVAQALGSAAHVVSVTSLAEARSVLVTHRFDLAILDVVLDTASGLELLPELRSLDGRPIPVIIFSPHTADRNTDKITADGRSRASTSLDDLLAAVHDRLTLRTTDTPKELG